MGRSRSICVAGGRDRNDMGVEGKEGAGKEGDKREVKLHGECV